MTTFSAYKRIRKKHKEEEKNKQKRMTKHANDGTNVSTYATVIPVCVLF